MKYAILCAVILLAGRAFSDDVIGSMPQFYAYAVEHDGWTWDRVVADHHARVSAIGRDENTGQLIRWIDGEAGPQESKDLPDIDESAKLFQAALNAVENKLSAHDELLIRAAVETALTKVVEAGNDPSKIDVKAASDEAVQAVETKAGTVAVEPVQP